MEYQEIIEIFKNEDYISGKSVDGVLEGFNLLARYINDKMLVQGAEHDIIYSVDVDTLIKYAVPKDVLTRLRNLHWFVDSDDILCCYT